MAAVVLVAVALTSCEEGPAGIFSRVADEKSTTTGMTEAFQYATPDYVVRLGTTYYAGIGTLWTKPEDGAWQIVDSGVLDEIKATSATKDTTAPLFSNAAAVIGSTMYALFSDSGTGENLGVWSTTDGDVWTAVTGLPTTVYCRSIISAGNDLFAITENIRTSTETKAAYSIYYLDGNSFSATNIVANETIGMPLSVAWDGTSYWFVTGSDILKGSNSMQAAATEPPVGTGYSGICSIPGGVMVATRTGLLAASTDGGATWIQNTPAFTSSIDKVYSLSVPAYIEYGTNKVLIVGTERKPRSSTDTPPIDGYLEFDVSGGFSASMQPTVDHDLLASAINFESSLAGKSVTSMPVFDYGTTKTIFALTDNQGLWSNTYESGAWAGWVRE